MKEREGMSCFAIDYLHSLFFFSLYRGHSNQLISGAVVWRWFLCLHCMDVSGLGRDRRSPARRRVYFHNEEDNIGMWCYQKSKSISTLLDNECYDLEPRRVHKIEMDICNS